MMIAGPATKENTGKIALSGPLTNIILSTIFIITAITFQNEFFWTIAVFGGWINALIAFINLIPFGIMDGLKVFWWNKTVWALAFITSIVLMTYTYGPALSSL